MIRKKCEEKLKSLIVISLYFMTFLTWASSDKRHNIPSVFDVVPLNNPVKESTAKFLLKAPASFDIDKVSFRVKNASRLFDKDQPASDIILIDGAQGKELHILISSLPPGFYQLFVKVKDKKNKEHEFKTKYKDHVMFVVDSSLQVPMPDPKLNDKTVAGIDSDGDGVRDDIQRWIDEAYTSRPKVKMAAKQFATGVQLNITSVNNKAQSIASLKKTLVDLHCLKYIAGIEQGINIHDELMAKFLNTKDRRNAEIQANANFKGQHWSIPRKEEDRKASCSFNPDEF